jgi:hypothetical protein
MSSTCGWWESCLVWLGVAAMAACGPAAEPPGAAGTGTGAAAASGSGGPQGAGGGGAETAGATGGAGIGAGGTGGDTGWPAGANGELPLAGIFYGNPLHGDSTGNSLLFRVEASRRFRAERSGELTAVRYNNRTLTDANIQDRCASQGPGSVWCDCVDAGLDRYTCGYTLPNSYSVGDGGELDIEIQSDDGSSKHLPSGEVLGQIAATFVPMEIADEQYPVLELAAPVAVEAGRIYHLVYRQLDPPVDCTDMPVPLGDAAGCDLDKGLVGLNGVFTRNPTSPRGGPYRGETAAVLNRQTPDGDWNLDDDNVSWYEVRYADDVWVGDAYTYYDAARTAETLGGQRQVRQRFAVEQTERHVNGLWIRVGRGSPEQDGDLTAELAPEGGPALATATVAAADVAPCDATANCFDDQVGWVFGAFAAAWTLEVGESYTLTLSAAQGAVYVASGGFALGYGPYQSLCRNEWTNAQAEVSADGSSWAPFADGYHADRDLSLLFTLEGMPTQLP